MSQYDELMHYGVPGMKWGHRKAVDTYGGSITKNGKYKASNGVVIGKSKNSAISAMRRFSTTVPGRALSAAGRGQMAKITGRSKESIKAQEKRERDALKEYYKVGGDKMLKKYAKNTINNFNKDTIKNGRSCLDRLMENVNKDGYQRQRKPIGTISENNKKRKPGYVKY